MSGQGSCSAVRPGPGLRAACFEACRDSVLVLDRNAAQHHAPLASCSAPRKKYDSSMGHLIEV